MLYLVMKKSIPKNKKFAGLFKFKVCFKNYRKANHLAKFKFHCLPQGRIFLALIGAWEMLKSTLQGIITKIWHLRRSNKHGCLSQDKRMVLFKTKLQELKLFS